MGIRGPKPKVRVGQPCAEPGCPTIVGPRVPSTGYLFIHCEEHRTSYGLLREDLPDPPAAITRRACSVCTAIFERYASHSRDNTTGHYYCTAVCRESVGKLRKGELRTCVVCPNEFYVSPASRQKACSRECKDTASRTGLWLTFTCQYDQCGKEFQVRESMAKYNANKYCSREHRNLDRRYRPGQTKMSGDGYVLVYEPDNPMAQPSTGFVFMHRKVVGDLLGRPLLPGEEVHHRWGDRTDNRPEALELWDHSQPAGQRVAERYRFYKEWIERVERERPLLEAAGVVFHDADELADA